MTDNFFQPQMQLKNCSWLVFARYVYLPLEIHIYICTMLLHRALRNCRMEYVHICMHPRLVEMKNQSRLKISLTNHLPVVNETRLVDWYTHMSWKKPLIWTPNVKAAIFVGQKSWHTAKIHIHPVFQVTTELANSWHKFVGGQFCTKIDFSHFFR